MRARRFKNRTGFTRSIRFRAVGLRRGSGLAGLQVLVNLSQDEPSDGDNVFALPSGRCQ